jgi:hypothetical protein
VSLVSANLEGANLIDANLNGANLTDAHSVTSDLVRCAWTDDETRLPPGVVRRRTSTSCRAKGRIVGVEEAHSAEELLRPARAGNPQGKSGQLGSASSAPILRITGQRVDHPQR